MANDLQLNKAIPLEGLGDFTYTVVTAGSYTVGIKSTLPANSALSIVIKQNSTTRLTIGGATGNPTPTQQAIGTSYSQYFAASDVIHVVLSSSASVDALPNSVKSTINLFLGL